MAFLVENTGTGDYESITHPNADFLNGLTAITLCLWTGGGSSAESDLPPNTGATRTYTFFDRYDTTTSASGFKLYYDTNDSLVHFRAATHLGDALHWTAGPYNAGDPLGDQAMFMAWVFTGGTTTPSCYISLDDFGQVSSRTVTVVTGGSIGDFGTTNTTTSLKLMDAQINEYQYLFEDMRIYNRALSLNELCHIRLTRGRDRNRHGLLLRVCSREREAAASIKNLNIKDLVSGRLLAVPNLDGNWYEPNVYAASKLRVFPRR